MFWSLDVCCLFLQNICSMATSNDFYWRTASGAVESCVNKSTTTCVACLGKHGYYSIRTSTAQNFTFTGSDVVSCFCQRTLAQHIFDAGIVQGAQAILRGKDADLCLGVATQFINYHAINVFASIVVVLVNISLRYVLQWMAAFEGGLQFCRAL